MTLHIFSYTITISIREMSLAKAIHNEQAIKSFDENRRKLELYMRRC